MSFCICSLSSVEELIQDSHSVLSNQELVCKATLSLHLDRSTHDGLEEQLAISDDVCVLVFLIGGVVKMCGSGGRGQIFTNKQNFIECQLRSQHFCVIQYKHS